MSLWKLRTQSTPDEKGLQAKESLTKSKWNLDGDPHQGCELEGSKKSNLEVEDCCGSLAFVRYFKIREK